MLTAAQNRVTASPRGLVRSAMANWRLTLQMARREVVGRYQGSVLGLAWSFFNPLLMLVVYTLIFSGVFKARWTGASMGNDVGDRVFFAINLFVGMIVHGLFAECVNRAPSLMLANANYIKRVVFPLEILPIAALGSAVFHACISLSVLVVATCIVTGGVPWSVVLVPVVLGPLLLITAGAAWLLSSLGVFLRDIAHITQVGTTVLLFLSPVFYPVDAAPSALQIWLRLNPLTYIIEWLRMVMLKGTVPELHAIFGAYLITAAIAWVGYWWFQKTRKAFADVL